MERQKQYSFDLLPLFNIVHSRVAGQLRNYFTVEHVLPIGYVRSICCIKGIGIKANAITKFAHGPC